MDLDPLSPDSYSKFDYCKLPDNWVVKKEYDTSVHIKHMSEDINEMIIVTEWDYDSWVIQPMVDSSISGASSENLNWSEIRKNIDIIGAGNRCHEPTHAIMSVIKIAGYLEEKYVQQN